MQLTLVSPTARYPVGQEMEQDTPAVYLVTTSPLLFLQTMVPLVGIMAAHSLLSFFTHSAFLSHPLAVQVKVPAEVSGFNFLGKHPSPDWRLGRR
jgi:hypothetical protein